MIGRNNYQGIAVSFGKINSGSDSPVKIESLIDCDFSIVCMGCPVDL